MISAPKLESNRPTIYIISGGVGASAEQLVYTVLAQFPEGAVDVFTTGNVRSFEQILPVLDQAGAKPALIIHTLVDPVLRQQLITAAAQKNVLAIDLMGDLMGWLGRQLGEPTNIQPGRYRRLHRDYYDRVAAIDYTLAHDDGKHPAGWRNAEIVLVGVSRSGKTPISLYLAVLGWKVANIPLVPHIEVAEQLYTLDPARCVGLILDADRLLLYRRQRQARLGVSTSSDYTDIDEIELELRAATRLYKRCGFTVLDTTDKTIEMSADEILRRIQNKPPTALPV
jgi:regulator of PEP synthase PpsR (kinase-PPPase family)